MSKNLSIEDTKLFLKQFPDFTEKKLKKMEQKMIKLYQNSIEDVERLVKNGFSVDFKDINPKEWIRFITNMMVKIDNTRGVRGNEKYELLLMFCVFIIIKHLPIDPILKEVLIIIIKEFTPEIVEGIIYATKKMHTFSSKLFKYLKKLICQ